MTIKVVGMSPEDTAHIVPPNTILLGYVGSISHGTQIVGADSIDDRDMMGCALGPVECYLGLKKFEQRECKRGVWDSVIYELRKFVHLLLKQNPNVMGLLWLQRKDYIHISPHGQLLIDNREMFMSLKAYHSFVGYAHSQLHRMTHGAYQGYMGQKRKALVDRFGYDTKNAAHLIRLLRMGIEYLKEGQLHVFREDNVELKAIKKGEWSLERVQKEAEDLFRLAKEAHVRSALPPEPNYDGAERLLVSIIKDVFGWKEEG